MKKTDNQQIINEQVNELYANAAICKLISDQQSNSETPINTGELALIIDRLAKSIEKSADKLSGVFIDNTLVT